MDSKYMRKKDMRYFPRWMVNNPVTVQVQGQPRCFEGKTRDLSCAGACIAGQDSISPQSKVTLDVELTKGTTIHLKGNVLWVQAGSGKPVMGVTFYDTTDEVQELILQHAFEIDKKNVLKQWYKGWDGKQLS